LISSQNKLEEIGNKEMMSLQKRKVEQSIEFPNYLLETLRKIRRLQL